MPAFLISLRYFCSSARTKQRGVEKGFDELTVGAKLAPADN
jgi:hypothetical protein